MTNNLDACGATPIHESGRLVSIGVPVRNGFPYIDEALALLVNQTYKNIEIVISDNGSDDQTADVCKEYAKRDPRIRYYRHDPAISIVENFRFVVERSTGEYFMWAAYDDRRSENYVETLLEKALVTPEASLVFSDVSIFSDFANWRCAQGEQYAFTTTRADGYFRKILNKLYIRDGYLHIYGLIKRKLLIGYGWPEIEVAPDRPLLFYLSCRGDFAKADGARFYCYKQPTKKSVKQRSRDNFGRTIKPFPYIRLAWVCAHAGYHAEEHEGRHRSLYLIFAAFVAFEVKKRAVRAVNKLRWMLRVKS